MAWKVEFHPAARRELDKLDRKQAKRILSFLSERIGTMDNPRSIGQALKGPRFGELWKYRVGDYRIITRIEDQKLIVLVLRIGHRKDVYSS